MEEEVELIRDPRARGATQQEGVLQPYSQQNKVTYAWCLLISYLATKDILDKLIPIAGQMGVPMTTIDTPIETAGGSIGSPADNKLIINS